MPELKSCPFCGGSAKLAGHDAPEFWARCDQTGCKASTEGFGSKDKAIAAWNRRALSSVQPVPKPLLAIEVLREWFGRDRYARDYEYLDANYMEQAERVAAFSALPTPQPVEGPCEVLAWLDMSREPAADWTKRVVATNPEFVAANGAENFAPLGILVASKW